MRYVWRAGMGVVCLAMIGQAVPSIAQVPLAVALAKPAAPAPAVAPGVLTPAQAQAVLEVLQNDQKRAQFITVLEDIGKVQAATAPKTAGLPLKPGSLGAKLLATASGALSHASGDLLQTVRALTSFSLFYFWIAGFARDPASRAALIHAAWRLAIVVLVGGLAQYLTMRALRRWRDQINQAAPASEVTEPPDPPAVDLMPADPSGPDADTTLTRRRPGKPTAWTLLRRVPYALLRLLIDLTPIGVFAAVVYTLLATPLGAAQHARLIVLALTDAYIALAAGTALVRAMLAPHNVALRLIHMSDATAAYLTRWAQRFLAVGLFGYAITEAGLLLGMYTALHDALAKLFTLVLNLFALTVVLQCRKKVARRLRARDGTHGLWAIARNRLAETWHIIAIFYIVALWLIFAFEVQDGFTLIGRYFLIGAATLIAARLTGIVLVGGIDRMLNIKPETAARYPGIDDRARLYQPALHRLTNTIVTLIAIFLLLQFWGLPMATLLAHGGLGGQIVSAIAKSLLVVIFAVVVWEAVNAALQGHLARLARDAQAARSARLRTLLPMLRTTVLVVIFVFAALTVLSQIGVNTAPLLAGAGVVGIAIGFGSQKLVQDVITGLFLLLENAMQVGDFVSLASLSGTVETLSIRTIRLRASDGSVHVIPFSAVTSVTNSTRDYGYAMIDVSAGYNEEPDHIADLLRDVAGELRRDPKWQDIVLGDLDIWGVDQFLLNAWVLRGRIKTAASQQSAVQREFNRRLKYRFDELAIESPFTSPRVLTDHPFADPLPPPPPPPPPASFRKEG